MIAERVPDPSVRSSSVSDRFINGAHHRSAPRARVRKFFRESRNMRGCPDDTTIVCAKLARLYVMCLPHAGHVVARQLNCGVSHRVVMQL